MSDNRKTIELVDLATDERLAWLEREQQERDMQASSSFGLAILAGSLICLAIMLMCSGCMVVVHPTEYVDRELADMSDGIHGEDRIQLEKLINEK